MEKKKVRIYKAQDGKGKFLNKTAQFLQKAQMGGAPANQDMEQYMAYTYNNLKDGLEPVVVYQNLVKGGLTEQMAYSVLTKVIEVMVSRGEMDPSQEQAKASQQPEQQQQQQPAEQSMGADQMSADQQAEEDAMLYPEDDTMQQEEDYANDTSQLGFQDGGEYDYEDTSGEGREAAIQQYESPGQAEMKPFDLDALIENTPGVQESLTFPGIESYIPNYQSVSWDNIDALDTALPEQKKGGSPKRSFVKNVMALLKKQDGGDGKQQGPVGSKANPLDNATDDVQKRKSNFLNTVKDSATKAATETLYEKLSQSKDPQLQQLAMQGEEQDMQSQEPMDMGEGMMQRGGDIPSWYAGVPNTMSPYQYRQYYKMMKKLMPKGLDVRDLNIAGPQYNKRTEMALPADPMDYTELAAAMAAQLGIPMAEAMMSGLMGPSIHVEDTDMFGRPKKYWIDYNGRKSSQLQADESTSKNNAKYYQHATPEEMIDSEIQYEEDVEQYPMAQMGGFTGGENPLTRFVQGGEDMTAPYYEDMYLPEAQFGGTPGYQMMNYIKNVADNYNEEDEDVDVDADTTADTDADTDTDTPAEQIRRATVRYVPNYVTTPGGFFRNVLPWNPGIGYVGSYGKQTSMPYTVGSRTPYTGSLAGATPVGRYVTKTSMLGRRPKKWVDVYDVGNGTPLTEEEARELSENLGGKGSKNSGPREKKASLQGLKYRLSGKNKKQMGGDLMEAQKGGLPTRADSLSLYNNALSQDAYYNNKYKHHYQKPIISPWLRELWADDAGMGWDDIKKEHLEDPLTNHSSASQKKNKIKSNKDKNKEYFLDLIPMALDWEAPLFEYDHRIKPQGQVEHAPFVIDKTKHNKKLQALSGKYKWWDYSTAKFLDNKEFRQKAKSMGFKDSEIKSFVWDLKRQNLAQHDLPGNITVLPYYDPLAIKPSDMLTVKEVKARFAKYGTSGISKKKLKEAGITDEMIQKLKDKKDKSKNKQKEVVVEKPIEEVRLPIRPINTASIEAMMTPSANDPRSLNLGAPQFEKSSVIPINNYGQEYVGQKVPIYDYKLVHTEDPNMPGLYHTKRIKYIAGYEDVGGMKMTKEDPSYYDTETGTYTTRKYQRGGYLPRAQFGPPGFETGTGVSMGIGTGTNNCTDADKRRPGSPCYDPNFVQANDNQLKGYSQNNPFAGAINYANARANPMGNTSLTGNVSYAETTGIQNDVAEQQKNRNLVAVENKRKDIRSFDPEAMVNVANAGIRAGTKMINNISNRNAENQFLKETTDVNNLYASQQPQFRGDWVDFGSQLGQYRFDQMGQDRSGFSAYGQKGGYMQNGGFLEEDEAYMTDEEIADFIANGGEIEYL